MTDTLWGNNLLSKLWLGEGSTAMSKQGVAPLNDFQT